MPGELGCRLREGCWCPEHKSDDMVVLHLVDPTRWVEELVAAEDRLDPEVPDGHGGDVLPEKLLVSYES